jgi:hypothetical protein
MTFGQVARWVGGLLFAFGLRAGGGGSAWAEGGLTTPQQPASTLYDQTNNAGSNSADSTDWGAHSIFRTSNSQAADDFVVPNNAIWRISSATASGGYIGAAGTGVLTLTVQFYNNASGQPTSLLVNKVIPAGSVGGLATGVFVATIAPALTLGPGHYWFSAQAAVNCSVSNCKHWVWTERSVQFGVASVWENPLMGVVPNCPTWQPRVDVCHNPSPSSSGGKDLLFKLDGTSTPIAATVLLPVVRR